MYGQKGGQEKSISPKLRPCSFSRIERRESGGIERKAGFSPDGCECQFWISIQDAKCGTQRRFWPVSTF